MKISVITPSFNQAEFIEETILSIIGQCYLDIEYIVIDGGSTDNSVDIIKEYEQQLAYWVSENDKGQAHAINKGFDKATGDILCWLNSDDMYFPGVFKYVAENLDPNKPELIFGNSFHFKEGNELMWGSNVVEANNKYDISFVDYIIQPSSFWTRKAWELTGFLNEDLHFGFDWDWYIRAHQAGVHFKPVNKYLSIYRVHDAHKSSVGGDKRREELIQVLKKYHGEEITELCENLHRKSRKIKQIQYYLKKLGLSKAEKFFLYTRFPLLFRNYSYDKVMAISRMI